MREEPQEIQKRTYKTRPKYTSEDDEREEQKPLSEAERRSVESKLSPKEIIDLFIDLIKAKGWTWRYPKGRELEMIYISPHGREVTAQLLVEEIKNKKPQIYDIGINRYLMKHPH